MSKRVLLISYYFAPQNTIGAIRPTKMAKYLERMGYEVTVICGGGLDDKVDPTLQIDLKKLHDVHLIREWNPLRERALKKAQALKDIAVQATKSAGDQLDTVAKKRSVGLIDCLKPVLGKGIDNLYLYLAWLSDQDFCRKAIREVRKLDQTYDCVLSSYATISTHEIGYYAKKSGKARKWIADFRDEVNMAFAWQAGRQRRYIRMVQKNADLITAVSYGVLDMMDMAKDGRVLTNGFDREDLPQADVVRDEKKLRIVYCGYISEGRKNAPHRDLSPMMKTIRQLIDEGMLSQEEVQLVYAGSQSALFDQVAAGSGLEACVENHGMVSRRESIGLQLSADILLMASWHMTGRKGILTGKLFEYMMMNKPVVCCMSGDLTGSDVKVVLDKTGIGFCYEQAGGQADAEALKAFVAEIIDRKHTGRPLLEGAHPEAINAYSYPDLAARMASWIDE